MRLSDKNLEALKTAAADCSFVGFGDVLMMVSELQKRRAADKTGHDLLQEAQAAANPPTIVLMDMLLERIENKESFLDRQVLAFFNGLKKGGYFQTICLVDKRALHVVLSALGNVGQDHLIRELVATRGIPTAAGEVPNPIDQLAADFKEGLTDADYSAN